MVVLLLFFCGLCVSCNFVLFIADWGLGYAGIFWSIWQMLEAVDAPLFVIRIILWIAFKVSQSHLNIALFCDLWLEITL